MTASPENIVADPQTERTFCAVHPTVETTLRCNKCGRYMCVRCSVPTPVGYRCKQCVHQQQDVFYSASSRDYLIAAAVSFALSVPIAFLLTRTAMGLFLIILLGLPAGGLISEAVHRAVGRRRGRYLWAVAAGGIVAGALVAAFPVVQATLLLITALGQPGSRVSSGALGGFFLGGLLPLILYVVLCAGIAIARLRYGK